MSKSLLAKCYQQKTTKKACERYQNLSKEAIEKKQQYGCKRYKNLSENEKNNWLSIERNIIE